MPCLNGISFGSSVDQEKNMNFKFGLKKSQGTYGRSINKMSGNIN